MALTLADNFQYDGGKPNFARDQLTRAQMDAMKAGDIDEGHISYCIDDKKHYKWVDGRWNEFVGVPFYGTLNISRATTAMYEALFSLMAAGEARWYWVTDSGGRYPSISEEYVTVKYDGATSPAAVYYGRYEDFGVNVGDILMMIKSNTTKRCMIIGMGAAHKSKGDFPGSHGLMAPEDKANIDDLLNRVAGLEDGGGYLTEDSVDTIHIKNGAVTEDKLSDEVKNKLNQTGGGGTSFSGSAEDVNYEGSLEATNVKDALDKLNEEKVDRDDNAPKLTAGFANNLVGRGEATEETIGFRASGGDTSIEDGTARIERLKGNTIVWNQLVNVTKASAQFDKPLYTFSFSDGIVSVSKDEGGTTTKDNICVFYSHNFIASKKYLIVYNLKRNDGQNSSHYIGGTGIYDGTKYHGLPNVEGDYKFFSPTESFTSTQMQISQDVSEGVTLSYTLRPVIYDLTQMFGVGNEPTTIEEFNARKPIGIDEYAYNEGEIISTNVDEIKSVGFNSININRNKRVIDKNYAPKDSKPFNENEYWNGIAYNGYHFVSDYRLTNISIDDNSISATTSSSGAYGLGFPVKVIPSGTYYCSFESTNCYVNVGYFDKDGVYLNSQALGVKGRDFTTPSNVYWALVIVGSNSANTAFTVKDLCIHLVHTGYRNGEYEPYEEFRRSLPISEIKDSDGNQLFPNGLLSAGSVYDEITATKAIKRIGVVDLGTLSWERRLYAYVYTFVGNYGGKTTFLNLLTNKYHNAGVVNASGLSDKEFRGNNTAPEIFIRDDSYTDATAFKAAMSGVMLYYELAEPIEVDLPEPLNMDYEVSDFGTEEVISDVPTTPLKTDIIYQFNAVDRIRDNSRHTKEADALLVALEERIKALESRLQAAQIVEE